MIKKSVIIFFLVAIIFILKTKQTNAQLCVGSLNCYVAQCSFKCSSSGASCPNGVSDCPPGDTCQNSCTYVFNGTNNCTGPGDSLCTRITISCLDSNGNTQSRQCSISSTPAPSATPGGGGGGGWGACGGCNCGHGTECQTDPNGNCVWNPSVCASGYTGCIPQCNPGQAGIGSGAGHCGQNPSQSCPYNGYDCGFGQGNCVGAASCCNGLVKDGGGNCQCPPPPSCSITLSPDPASVTVGGQTYINVAVNSLANGSIQEIDFTSSNAAIATASPFDVAAPFQTVVTGVATGAVTVTADAIINGQRVCSDNVILNVLPPRGWWQVKDADIISNGNMTSLIPTTCVLPGCTPTFDLDGTGTFPGLVAYGGGAYDFSAGITSGTVSSKNWIANTSYKGPTYDYAYFENLIPTDVTINPISGSVNGGTFNSGGTPSHGFVWYRSDGDLTINSNVNLVGNRKVVLLVRGGNLNIQGKINIQNRGNGFFAAIVGKAADGSKGDINIDPGVTDNNFAVEGIYMADHQINTGASASPLRLRGSFVAWEGVNLQRDLGNNNRTAPAEYFEYAPDLIFTFPRSLTRNRIVWREIAP